MQPGADRCQACGRTLMVSSIGRSGGYPLDRLRSPAFKAAAQLYCKKTSEAPGLLHSRRAPYLAPFESGVNGQPLRHSLMNFLRSSPLSFLSPASLLHDFILSCCAFCFGEASGSSPFRHELMYFLRSSPFLSVALSLQFFMRSCCAACFAVGSFFAFSAAGAAFLSSVVALSAA